MRSTWETPDRAEQVTLRARVRATAAASATYLVGDALINGIGVVLTPSTPA